jgi:hypothetical protein
VSTMMILGRVYDLNAARQAARGDSSLMNLARAAWCMRAQPPRLEVTPGAGEA